MDRLYLNPKINQVHYQFFADIADLQTGFKESVFEIGFNSVLISNIGSISDIENYKDKDLWVILIFYIKIVCMYMCGGARARVFDWGSTYGTALQRSSCSPWILSTPKSFSPLLNSSSCRWSLKYADFILCRRNKIQSKRSVMCMILNCVWCWSSNSGDLESIEYSFFTITPTLTRRNSTCKGSINGWKRSIISIIINISR